MQRMDMKRWSMLTAVAVAACGGSGPATQTSGLKLVSNAKLGQILADGGGRTLCLFALDVPGGTGKAAVSNCTDAACAGLWPAFDVKGGKLDGVDAADVGEITR